MQSASRSENILPVPLPSSLLALAKESLPSNSSSSKNYHDKALSSTLAMSEQRYLSSAATRSETVPRESNLPGRSTQPTTTTSSSSAYPELTTPFSAVSSFNLPASCDSTLLTPVSNAESPPLRQTSKTGHSAYHQSGSASAVTAAQQEPTPPASTSMQWPSPYEMTGHTSQSASPLTGHHPSVPESHFDMAYSRDDDIPPPHSEPFFGSFGVSGNNSEPSPLESNPMYIQAPYYNMPAVSQASSSMMLEQRASPFMPMQRPMTASNGAPTLQHPRARDYYRQRHDEQASTAALDQPAYLYPTATVVAPRRKGSKGSKVTKRPAKGARGRTPSSASGAAGRASSQELHRLVAEAEQEKQEALNRLMARVKPGCPVEERWLIERKQMLKEHKGKNHWELIKAAYEDEFNKECQQACLQMRYNRAKAKWIEWADDEARLLQEAFNEYESKRYQSILNKFKELGGCREIEWNTTNIEKKLVELGLEDMYMNQSTKIRRRVRLGADSSPNSSGSRARGGRGGALPPPVQAHAGATDAFGYPVRHDSMLRTMSASSGMTLDQEDELLDQIDSRGVKDEPLSSEEPASPMDMSFASSRERALSSASSARVARQACDEIMRAAPRHDSGGYYHASRVMT